MLLCAELIPADGLNPSSVPYDDHPMIRRRNIPLNFIVVGLFVRIKGFKKTTPD